MSNSKQWDIKPFTPVEWEQWHNLWKRIFIEVKALEKESSTYQDNTGVNNINPNQSKQLKQEAD